MNENLLKTGTSNNIIEGMRHILDAKYIETILTTTIFPDLPSEKMDGIKRLSEQIYQNIHAMVQSSPKEFIDSYVQSQMIDSKILDAIPKNIHPPISIRQRLKDMKPTLDQKQQHEFMKLIHAVVLNQLPPAAMLGYLQRTFPLWSNIKRLLLMERKGTGGQKNWEYVVERCYSRNPYDIQTKFEQTDSYMQLHNADVKEVTGKLVDYVTGYHQFENVIYQGSNKKGWFPNGLYAYPEQHNVTQDTLYRLGYAFRLTFEDFTEHLAKGSVNYHWNPFDAKQNIMLYGMAAGISYKKAKVIASEFNTPQKIATISAHEAQEKIKAFFASEDVRNTEKFLALLEEIGTSTKDECADNLKRYLNEALDALNIANVRTYYDKWKDERLPFCKEQGGNREICTVQEYIDSSDLLLRSGDALNISSRLRGNRRKMTNATKKNAIDKIAVLKLLMDGAGLASRGESIAKYKWTPTRISDLLDGKKTVTRDDIIRVGYIKTLINYINDTKSHDILEMTTNHEEKQKLVDNFITNTNKMLEECLYAPIHSTRILDGACLIALASVDRCIPEVFQMFLPNE